MSEENKSFDLVRIVCLAAGILIGMVVIRVVFDFGPILGGALGGGIGALLGMLIYGFVGKRIQK